MYIDNGQYYDWGKLAGSPSLRAMNIITNFDPTDDDKAIINNVLMIFTCWEREHPVPGGENRISALILYVGDHINVHINDNATGESFACFLVQWDKVRSVWPNDLENRHLVQFAILLEELCHGLYMIRDEYEVKEYMIQILRQFFPNVRLHNIYPKMFDRQDHRVQIASLHT